MNTLLGKLAKLKVQSDMHEQKYRSLVVHKK